MKTMILWIAALVSLTSGAQTTVHYGKKVKEQRQVSTFTKLDADGAFDILLKDGNGPVVVEGPEDLVAMVVTDIEAGTLVIYIKNDVVIKPSLESKITIKIPFEVLNEISLKGAGTITCNKTIHNNIKLMVNGAGSIALTTYSPKTDATVVGCGNISLKGWSQRFRCDVQGSGSIKANTMESDNAEAAVVGSGIIKIQSSKTIKGRISGNGTIAIAGEPEGQDLMRMGSGQFCAL